jgi:RNA polymerase sigma factor (sigma-70 family)
MTERAARLADLLLRARAGERGALEEIVHELNPLLWHVARAQGLAPDPAADVVQTTWLEFLRLMHTIHTPQALTGWLVTATQREAWRVRRRERTGAVPESDAVEELAAPAPDVEDRLLADERARTLWRAVSGLSERCRQLLRIVAMVDRPDYDVVSTALGMPRGSVGPTRARCLAKLRESLLADAAWSR